VAKIPYLWGLEALGVVEMANFCEKNFLEKSRQFIGSLSGLKKCNPNSAGFGSDHRGRV